MIYLDVTPNHTIPDGPSWSISSNHISDGCRFDDGTNKCHIPRYIALVQIHSKSRFFVSPVMWTYEMMLERASGGWVDLVIGIQWLSQLSSDMA